MCNENYCSIYKLAQKGISTKFLNAIRSLYCNTKAVVWNGEEVWEEFETKFGIKEGCNLSPALFTLFIDDLGDFLPGGVDVGDTRIKLLKYADDIVMFAKAPETLQLMLNRLDKYCEEWGLTVNLSKSKAMIFRNGGGRHVNNEKWWYKGQQVEVVKEYTYLGCIITPTLNLKKHHVAKVGEAKAAMAITWKNLMQNRNITSEAKYKIFKSTSMSIAMYADGAWGFKKSDEIESLQRMFLKRTFRLPQKTPNYALSLETGLAELHLTTLKHHFTYVTNVMKSEKDKLGKKNSRVCYK